MYLGLGKVLDNSGKKMCSKDGTFCDSSVLVMLVPPIPLGGRANLYDYVNNRGKEAEILETMIMGLYCYFSNSNDFIYLVLWTSVDFSLL
jgi:hypothetical protein